MDLYAKRLTKLPPNVGKGIWYVTNLPGAGGVDWGYTDDPRKAIRLSPYWQRRFGADMRHLGAIYSFAQEVAGTPCQKLTT